MPLCPHGNGWQLEWLTTWDEVWDPSFVAQWQSWIDHWPTAHVFFEPSVVRAWVEAHSETRSTEPLFLIARRGGEHAVMLPAVLTRYGWKDAWQRVIQPVGFDHFDYHDPIIAGQPSPQLWRDFWTVFVAAVEDLRKGDFLAIPRVHGHCAHAEERFSGVGTAPLIDLSAFTSFEAL